MSAIGTLTLYIDDAQVGQGEIWTQPGQFGLAGTGRVRRSRQRLDPSRPTTRAPFPFEGGTIERVVVDVSGDAYVDHEKEVLAWLARD